MNLRLSIDRAVDARFAEIVGSVPDPGGKAEDVPGERPRRHAALGVLRAALDVEDAARRETAAVVSQRAEDAAWLGASLADLATVTGRTRQAARKRWSDLGDVSRRRSWLARQVDGVRWAAELVVRARGALAPTADDGFDAAAEVLAAALDDVGRLFPEAGAGRDDATDPTRRWRLLDALVDHHLRTCVHLASEPPEGSVAAFAVHGARGVVGSYDHARGRDAG